MIVRCNVGCRLTDGITDASLDLDTNNAMCNECGEVLTDVSEYSKLSMKTNGDILRTKKKKAFVFPCQTCNEDVETEFVSSRLVGKACPNNQDGCKIDITQHMVKAIEETKIISDKIKEHDAIE